MADMFNDYFASVFTKEGNGPVPEDERMTFDTELQDIEVQREKVDEKMRKLHTSAAAGLDRIGAGLLQNLREEVVPIPYLLLYSGSHKNQVKYQKTGGRQTLPRYTKKGPKQMQETIDQSHSHLFALRSWSQSFRII
jgi:hypothetical protein